MMGPWGQLEWWGCLPTFVEQMKWFVPRPWRNDNDGIL